MKKHSRGAVMVETALFVSAALLFMLGTIQIGVVGFVQLTADGAAYYDARGNVLGVSTTNYATAEQATTAVFPQISPTNISPTILPAATPAIPVDYGYNDPNPTTAQNSALTRHGGASMLTPAQEQITVTVPGLAHILGQAFGANSSYVEPLYQECGTHFDIANVACSLASPPANSQTNYFTQGENTPPYMVGRNLLQQCNDTMPFGTYAGGNTNLPSSSTWAAFNDSRATVNSNWTGPCVDTQGDNTVGYISMGTAEFLHTQNWSDAGTGGSSSNGSGISGACDTSGGTAQNVFEAIAFHQRTYAQLGQYFANNPEHYEAEFYSALWDYSNFSHPQTDNQLIAYYSSNIESHYNNFPLQEYGPGNKSVGATAIPEAILTFENWEGFDDASHGPGQNDIYNTAVHTIYSWDKTVDAGEQPGKATYNNPTAPDNGCT